MTHELRTPLNGLMGFLQLVLKQVTSAPLNIAARGTWFTQYIASAEKQEWLVYQDSRIDPTRPATRAEVVATLVQAFDVPRLWPTGSMFNDVSRRTRYAASIETAVTLGLVSGYTDANGSPTGVFGPNNSINRAEIAKMLTLAIELFLEDTPNLQPNR